MIGVNSIVRFKGSKQLYLVLEIYNQFPYDQDVDCLIVKLGSSRFEDKVYTCVRALELVINNAYIQLSLFD